MTCSGHIPWPLPKLCHDDWLVLHPVIDYVGPSLLYLTPPPHPPPAWICTVLLLQVDGFNFSLIFSCARHCKFRLVVLPFSLIRQASISSFRIWGWQRSAGLGGLERKRRAARSSVLLRKWFCVTPIRLFILFHLLVNVDLSVTLLSCGIVCLTATM
jgi:hypothetical protein